MKLIIFDCDGVLVDSEALLVDLEMSFLKQHGLVFSTDSYIEQFMGIPVDDWIAKVSALLINAKGESLPEDFFKPLDERIIKKLNEELKPIQGAFDAVQLVENGKPAPDLFLHAANELGKKPAECVVVEDSANGVIAGKRAGMKVIGFTGGGHCPPNHASSLRNSGADDIAESFSDIIALLN